MLYHRRIGSCDIYNIIEYAGPTHDPRIVFPDLLPEDIQVAARELGAEQYVAHMNRFVVAIQIWVLRCNGRIVVIDTGVGNGKTRRVPRMSGLNTRTLEWLAAAGATAETVTDVVNTHLHSDHVGWNVCENNGVREVTFPKARHYLPRADLDHFGKIYDGGDLRASDGAFADSVIPVLDLGNVEIVDGPAEICDGLRIVPAHGHTSGMFVLELASLGEKGVFSADVFHSPIQIMRPELNTAFCILPEEARDTRRAFLERHADTGALIMPCHFGFPHCGRIVRENESFRFVPDMPVLSTG